MSRKPSKSRENPAAAERLADWKGEETGVGQFPLSIADNDSPDYERGAFGQEGDDLEAGIETLGFKDGDRDKVRIFNVLFWLII